MSIKRLLFLVLIFVFFVPSFVGAEVPVVSEESVVAEKELRRMSYNGENSNWMFLNDRAHKKASTIQYFDKDGEIVETLSLEDEDKVLIKMNSDNEIVSVQMYSTGFVGNNHESNLQQGDVGVQSEESSEVMKDKPLYKEDGVWKN